MRTENGKQETHNNPGLLPPRAPWNRLEDPFLSCWTWVYGRVGLYWLMPLWLTMYIESPWDVVSTSGLDCPRSQNNAPEVCPGLPRGCHTEVHRVTAADWRQYRALHRYFMMYQCDTLDVDDDVTLRFGNGALVRNLYPADDKPAELFVVVTAGVPLASAIVTEQDAMWYLSLLCSATRSGGGSLLVRHLQFLRPQGLRLCSMPEAVPFRLSFKRGVSPGKVFFKEPTWTHSA